MKQYKYSVTSDKLVKGCDKQFEIDMQFLEELLRDAKIMITDKNGNTFLIDQGNIKPVLKNDDKGIK